MRRSSVKERAAGKQKPFSNSRMNAGRCPVNPISEGKEDGVIRGGERNKGSGQSDDRRLDGHVLGSGLRQRCIVGTDPEVQKC